MSYDKPITSIYPFAVMDFGATAGDTTNVINGPAGKKGRLKSITARATEVFACSTKAANVKIGSAGDLDKYAQLNIADGTANLAIFTELDDTDAIIDADIAANAPITVTFDEGTDGSAVTGQAVVTIFIDWY